MSENSGIGSLLVLAAIAVILVLFVACDGACVTSQGETASTLTKAGFSDIHVGGWNFWACGSGDKRVGRDFAATNPAGGSATGTVCCGFAPVGFGKGCTIRY